MTNKLNEIIDIISIIPVDALSLAFGIYPLSYIQFLRLFRIHMDTRY